MKKCILKNKVLYDAFIMQWILFDFWSILISLTLTGMCKCAVMVSSGRDHPQQKPAVESMSWTPLLKYVVMATWVLCCLTAHQLAVVQKRMTWTPSFAVMEQSMTSHKAWNVATLKLSMQILKRVAKGLLPPSVVTLVVGPKASMTHWSYAVVGRLFSQVRCKHAVGMRSTTKPLNCAAMESSLLSLKVNPHYNSFVQPVWTNLISIFSIQNVSRPPQAFLQPVQGHYQMQDLDIYPTQKIQRRNGWFL